MRTLELLDYLVDLARRIGCEVREEWLDGAGGGWCQIKGRKVLFVDQSLGAGERVQQVARSLRGRDELATVYILPEARQVLDAA